MRKVPDTLHDSHSFLRKRACSSPLPHRHPLQLHLPCAVGYLASLKWAKHHPYPTSSFERSYLTHKDRGTRLYKLKFLIKTRIERPTLAIPPLLTAPTTPHTYAHDTQNSSLLGTYYVPGPVPGMYTQQYVCPPRKTQTLVETKASRR